MSSAPETLRRDFGGDIIEPGGAEYESASGSVLASGRPAYVLRSGLAISWVGGAVSRVPDDATAYAHRQAELMFVTTTAGPKPAVDAARPALEAIWGRLAPHVNGAYANFLGSATEEDVAAIYPTETYRRLAAVKRQYDTGNLFARNHNVRPQ